MKILLSFLLAALASVAAAQTSLPGTWQGRLEVAPGKTIGIHFVIKAEPGGKYSAVVTSPDDGAIKNVPADSVQFADNRLTIDVRKLSGGYAGTLRGGAFEGEWSQEGAKLPLSLKPLKQAMTKTDIDVLRGEWSGPLKTNGLEVTIVLRFTSGAEGTLQGVMDVPEQGVKGLKAVNIKLEDGHFHIEQPDIYGKIDGVLKGDKIVGHWDQVGNSVPITLTRGRFVAATKYLDIPAAAREQIAGRWSGTLNGLAVIVRFEMDAQGRTVGFFDSVQQNILNIPITHGKLAGTTLTFGISGFGGNFNGALAGNQLKGEWTQTGLQKPLPFVLTREK